MIATGPTLGGDRYSDPQIVGIASHGRLPWGLPRPRVQKSEAFKV